MPQLNINIDYTNPIADDVCNFCIPVFDKKYLTSNDIDSCLRDDLNSINENIKKYNNRAETLINELNLKITDYVKLKIPTKWDIMELPEPLRCYTKQLYSKIGSHVRFYNEKRYGKRGYPFVLQKEKYYTKNKISKWKLYLVTDTLVISDNEKEIDEIQKTITEFFDTVINGKDFETLNVFFEQIREDYKNYQKKIRRVIKKLEDGILLKEEPKEPLMVRSYY